MTYLAELKKPHRVFNRGDLVIGDVWNGQGTNLLCTGWSTKLNRMIEDYVLRYQGWDGSGQGHIRLVASAPRVWRDFRGQESRLDHQAFLRALTAISWEPLEDRPETDPRPVLRRLSQPSGGNVPQTGERRHGSPTS